MKNLILITILFIFCNLKAQNRWNIKGDFNGDGTSEILKESCISMNDGKEIPDFNDTDNFEKFIEKIIALNPRVTLKSTKLNDLIVAEKGQLLGISWLENIGDINNDKTDEIALVIDWADYSNINRCKIYTYKNNKWNLLDEFMINESQMNWLEDEEEFKSFVVKENGIYKGLKYNIEDGEIIKHPLN